MKNILLPVLLLMAYGAFAQKGKIYADSLAKFRANYVATHEVVKGDNKKYFDFYPADESFVVHASFTRYTAKELATMKTFIGTEQEYIKYGILQFKLKGQLHELVLYQSVREIKMPGYENYLFLPFTDSTNARSTYGGGRYIDVFSTEIQKDKLLIDFNKAYNPYCAYTSGFQCPIPPKENDLPIAVTAGEKNFLKGTH